MPKELTEIKSIEARAILENPIWEETFDKLSQYYYAEFRANIDPQMRERIALAHDLLDDFQAQLEASVAEGIVVPLEKAVGDNTDE